MPQESSGAYLNEDLIIAPQPEAGISGAEHFWSCGGGLLMCFDSNKQALIRLPFKLTTGWQSCLIKGKFGPHDVSFHIVVYVSNTIYTTLYFSRRVIRFRQTSDFEHTRGFIL